MTFPPAASTRPRAWGTPPALVRWAAVSYAAVALLPGLALCAQPTSARWLALWAAIGVAYGAPVVLGTAIAAARRDAGGRALSPRAVLRWAGHATAAVLTAHWLPLLPWSVVAAQRATQAVGDARAQLLGDALVGLVAWVALLAAGGLEAWTRRYLATPRSPRGAAPLAPGPVAVPTLHALVWAPPAAAAGPIFIAAGWPVRDALGGGLLLLGASALAAGAGAWGDAHAAARASGSADRVFARRFGAALFITAAIASAPLLAPVDDAALGSRFVLQALWVGAASAGAAAWGAGGVDAPRRTYAAPDRTAP